MVVERIFLFSFKISLRQVYSKYNINFFKYEQAKTAENRVKFRIFKYQYFMSSDLIAKLV
jgi:hypothetical protein